MCWILALLKLPAVKGFHFVLFSGSMPDLGYCAFLPPFLSLWAKDTRLPHITRMIRIIQNSNCNVYRLQSSYAVILHFESLISVQYIPDNRRVICSRNWNRKIERALNTSPSMSASEWNHKARRNPVWKMDRRLKAVLFFCLVCCSRYTCFVFRISFYIFYVHR